jgi:hypothetical protein
MAKRTTTTVVNHEEPLQFTPRPSTLRQQSAPTSPLSSPHNLRRSPP